MQDAFARLRPGTVEQFGRAPRRVATDPGFFSAANESKAEQMGVKRVSIPSHDTKSPARKQRQKQLD